MNFIFIDLDGTIEDSRVDMVNCANAVRKNFGLDSQTFEQLVPHVTKGMDHLYRNAFAEIKDLEKVQKAYDQFYFDHVAIETKLYDNMKFVLSELTKISRIIVITNKPEKISRHLLKELGVAEFITDVMGGDSCEEIKPNPLPIQIAAKRWNFQRGVDNAVMIGDSQADMEIAARFEIPSTWCAWGYAATQPKNPQSQFVANTPNKLIEITQRLI